MAETKAPRTKLSRPESEAWNAGMIYWVLVSWATPWIVRWGINGEERMSRIKSEDLGQYGDEEDETTATVVEFERLFAAQSALDAKTKESLSWTMVAFASKLRLLTILLVTSCHQACLYIGPVVLVDCTMKYLHTLAMQRQIPGMVTNDTLFGPLCCLVGGFLGLPLMTALTATISFLTNLKLNIRLMGALSAAIFRKAQRLPLSEGDRDLEGRGKVGKEEAKEQGRATQQHYSLVRLMATDVDSLMGIQFAVAKVFALVPIVIILGVMLYMKLRMATFVALATAVIAFFAFMRIMGRMVGYLMAAQHAAGLRLSMLQETMFAVRLVKSCAWEEPCEKAVDNLRNLELANMYWFWFFGGLSGVFFTIVARIMIFASVGSYAFFYKDMSSTDVFTMMQILNAFRNAINNFSQTAPTIVNAGPSVLRLSNFLKLDEAAVPDTKESSKAAWVKVWPKADVPAAADKPMLRIKGSFASTSAEEGTDPLLHDLDISIAKGDLVAVLGEVGSGKTVLLQAILGEMKPVGNACIEIPQKIAYHSQAPVIYEATLRENVIFWSGQEDESRYHEAIQAASLVSDLQVLPGGDRVLIGSRGISLSGGQKARVSLARAAYNIDAEVVLLDDPFASVDAPTGQHLLRNLLLGDLMKQRTRVVVCQPEKERIAAFDRVIVMSKGRVVADGKPEEVYRTQAFTKLLSVAEREMYESSDGNGNRASAAANSKATAPGDKPKRQQEQAIALSSAPGKSLREEETEGRADMETLDFFFRLGHRRLVALYFVFFVVAIMVGQVADTMFAKWTDLLVLSEVYHTSVWKYTVRYLLLYLFWACMNGVIFFGSFMLGAWWSLRISKKIHNTVLQNLLGAPVDLFHDKTPVGRIMNRLTYDQSQVDYSMYAKMGSFVGAVSMIVTPLCYIHIIMPLFFTVVMIPFHYLLFSIVRSYWRVMIPLRYLTTTSRSAVANYTTEVETGSVTTRAYQVGEVMSHRQISALDHTLRSEFACSSSRRWTVNRLTLLWGFMGGAVCIVVVMMPDKVSIGFASLCLMNIVMILGAVDFTLENATALQFEFVSMNRIHEYTKLPQEAPRRMPGDDKYRDFVVSVSRAAIGPLQKSTRASGVVVVRGNAWKDHSAAEPVLEVSEDGLALVPSGANEGTTLSVLAPENAELAKCDRTHRLMAVNGCRKDVAKILEELCEDQSTTVKLHIQSGWLTRGASIKFDCLRVGYGDVPRDVLKGVNFVIESKCKAAIAGTTGCGKSTMMLALLRIIEPRGGRILIGGVDTKSLGLNTLRKAVGLVPQDPIIFSASIRRNLDPFNDFSDDCVWDCLSKCMLKQHVLRLGGLDAEVKAEGDNLSFGQRQLLSIARMVIRQPAILLLDEATSAIDPATQEAVQNTIRAGFPDSTIMAIAHRLETILDFDMVVVLDKGEVVEMGTVSELKDRKGGLFNKMLAAKQEEL